MKKTAKALTISATILLLFAVLGLFCLFFLDLLIQVSEDKPLYRILSSIPVSQLTDFGLTLVISIVLCFTVCSKKSSFWCDIVLPGAVLFVLSAVSTYVYTLYVSIAEALFDEYIYYRYSTNELINIGYSFVEFLVPVAVGLLLVACGMSIAYKHLTRKQEKALSASSEEQIFPDAVQNP